MGSRDNITKASELQFNLSKLCDDMRQLDAVLAATERVECMKVVTTEGIDELHSLLDVARDLCGRAKAGLNTAEAAANGLQFAIQQGAS